MDQRGVQLSATLGQLQADLRVPLRVILVAAEAGLTLNLQAVYGIHSDDVGAEVDEGRDHVWSTEGVYGGSGSELILYNKVRPSAYL